MAQDVDGFVVSSHPHRPDEFHLASVSVQNHRRFDKVKQENYAGCGGIV